MTGDPERPDAKNTAPCGTTEPALGRLEHLQYVERDRVALITINRPAVHNAISLFTMGEFEAVLDWLESRSEVCAVVLTGSGDRVFVSGGDLKDFERLDSYDSAFAMSRRMQALMMRFERLPVPVIGAINGDCVGGGCEVALAMDLRVVSDAAHFGFKQVTLGITPAWGGRRRLLRMVGRARALSLLLSGETMDAAEAYRIGLANTVVPRGQTVSAALEVARQIASNPPFAVRTIKRAVNRDEEIQDEESAAFEADLFGLTWMSDDHWEALTARREKRAPIFRGR